MTIGATIGKAAAARRRWDVLIVGAGPAGTLLARQVAGDGLRVLLVDRSAFPRDKVCGGCLSARTVTRLGRLGLRPALDRLAGQPLRSFRLAGWQNRVEFRLPGGLAVSRKAFDAMLLQAAISAGAEFLPGTPAELGELHGNARSVLLGRHDGAADARAAVVVDAAGLGGALVGSRGAATGRRRVGCSAMVDHRDGAYVAGTIYMAVARHGYVGLARLETGLLNVAAAIEQTAARRQGVARVVQTILKQAGCRPVVELETASWSGTPVLWQRPGSRAARRLIAVGDAAGYVEPFTGEGIGWALRSAELAAPLVAHGARGWSDELIQSWNDVYRRELASTQRSCRALARLLRRPTIARLTLVALRHRPALGAYVVRRLHGDRLIGQGAT